LSGGRYIKSAIANLGETDIDLLTLESEGVKEVIGISTEKQAVSIREAVENIKKGLKLGNVLFSNKVTAEKNSTYVLRSIAYKTKSYVEFYGYTYNEFDYDKRRDIVVAFRMVEKNDDGSVVLLWKELRNEKAPKLKLKSD
jgi:hypothetical protein